MANMQTIFPMSRVLRPTKDGGCEEVYYSTSMDLNKLAILAKKAAGNKSRKSSVGPVTVEVLEVNKLK